MEPGGTIEVYQAGTTTQQTVYSDRGLTTTAGYIITADAAGRLPERWIADTTVIKLVYKDSAGATLATRDYANDNADSLEANTTLYLATYAALTALTSGSGLKDNGIYYTYARTTEEDGGAGFWRYDSASTATANGGTILAIDGGGAGRFFRLRDKTLCPRWFGCVADGATNDAAAFQLCLNACTAGETVDGEGLRYKIGTTLNMLKASGFPNDVTVKNATIIATVADDLDAFQVYGSGTALTGLSASTAATVTITIASPGVITWTGHGLAAGTPIKLSTTGALPTGLTAGTTYFVLSTGLAANTFRVSATPEGAAINTSGSQSGTHTGTRGLIAGTTSITATGAVAGDAGKFIWLASSDKTCPTKASTYLTGELIRIRSVSGTTITLEHGLRNHYLNSITATLVNPIEGVRFEDVAFEGDSTITQGGIHFYRCFESYASVRSKDMGYAAVYFDQCAGGEVDLYASNPNVNTDNGTDYGVVIAQGCDNITSRVNARHLRHAVATGGTLGLDYNLRATVNASDMKDAAIDAHPNVMGFVADVSVVGARTGGTFSSQPVGVAYQGGGVSRFTVDCDGPNSSVVLYQPHMQTLDDVAVFDVTARNIGASVTRIFEGDLYKDGGSIRSLKVQITSSAMAAAGSRCCSISFANAVSGVNAKGVEIDVNGEATEYVALLSVTSGRTVNFAKFTGYARQLTTANYGFAAFGFITDVLFLACETEGVAGAFGVRADTDVGHARAIGCRATNVGGAGITNQAEVGIDSSTGGTYT